MAYELTEDAGRDLDGIGVYTADRWGLDQAVRYLDGLHDLLERLSSEPALSRDSSDLRPGYWRARYERHVVFFRLEDGRALIVRILHGAMDFTQHL